MKSVFVSISPFLLTIFIEAISPMTNHFWKKRMRSEAGSIGEAGDQEKLIQVLNHALDSIRLTTTSLLTAVSGLLALNQPMDLIVCLFILVVLVLILPFFWKHQRLYSKYATKGYCGYTPASIFIIFSNISFSVIVWISASCPFLSCLPCSTDLSFGLSRINEHSLSIF